VGLEQLWASWLLLAALLHQLVIAGIAGAVLVLRHDLYKRQAVSRATYAMVAGGVVAAAAWVAFALSDVQAWMAVVDPTDVPRTARLTFLALPNFFDPIIFPWREALPILGTAFVVALMGLAWRLRRAPVGRGPLAVVAVSLAILALVATPQLTTRYCFYLYPVLLTLLVQAIEEGARALRAPDLGGSGPAALALAIFAIGGDFHPGHIADVASQEASYRIGPWRRYEDLWYPRIDFRGPAEFLNQEIPAQRNEPVIVVGQDPVAHWLERPYAMYFRPNSSVFTYLGRKRGTIHLWSGRPIVATPEHVQALCARATTAWILRSVEPRRHGFNASEIWGARFIAERRAYVGEDGRLEVVRVSLTPSTAALAETGSRGQ
jgi:hypothetical protein